MNNFRNACIRNLVYLANKLVSGTITFVPPRKVEYTEKELQKARDWGQNEFRKACESAWETYMEGLDHSPKVIVLAIPIDVKAEKAVGFFNPVFKEKSKPPTSHVSLTVGDDEDE